MPEWSRHDRSASPEEKEQEDHADDPAVIVQVVPSPRPMDLDPLARPCLDVTNSPGHVEVPSLENLPAMVDPTDHEPGDAHRRVGDKGFSRLAPGDRWKQQYQRRPFQMPHRSR